MEVLESGRKPHVVRSLGEPPRLQPEWERLASHERRDGLFRAHAWNVHWLRHVAQATPHVVTVTRGGELVGLVSLCETVFDGRFLRLRALSVTGRDVGSGDFLDILAAQRLRGERFARRPEQSTDDAA